MFRKKSTLKTKMIGERRMTILRRLKNNVYKSNISGLLRFFIYIPGEIL